MISQTGVSWTDIQGVGDRYGEPSVHETLLFKLDLNVHRA